MRIGALSVKQSSRLHAMQTKRGAHRSGRSAERREILLESGLGSRNSRVLFLSPVSRSFSFCAPSKGRDHTAWQDAGASRACLSRRCERGSAQGGGSGGRRAAAAPRRRICHLRCELPGVRGR